MLSQVSEKAVFSQVYSSYLVVKVQESRQWTTPPSLQIQWLVKTHLHSITNQICSKTNQMLLIPSCSQVGSSWLIYRCLLRSSSMPTSQTKGLRPQQLTMQKTLFIEMDLRHREATRSMKVYTLKSISRVANQYWSISLNKTAKILSNVNITWPLSLCNTAPKTMNKESILLIKMILLQTSVMLIRSGYL